MANMTTLQSIITFDLVLISLSSICAVLIFLYTKLRTKDRFNIQKHEIISLICSYLCGYGAAMISEIFFQTKGILLFYVLFSILGFILEYFGDWVWFRLMGARLFTYYKYNLLNFTSWFMLPYWGAAGMYFIGVWHLFGYGQIRIDWVEFTKALFMFSAISLTVTGLIFSFGEYLRQKLTRITGFSWWKYMFLNAFMLGAIIPTLFYFRIEYTIFYFIITAGIGLVLEAYLDRALRRVLGEYLWVYWRGKMLGLGTSWLVFPCWFIAIGIALILNFALLTQ